jgi:hypothetical protein
MIISRLLTTLRLSPLSGALRIATPLAPRIQLFALVSPWEPEHEQID